MFMAGHVSMWRVSLGQNGWAGHIESEKKNILTYKARLFPMDGALVSRSGHPWSVPPTPIRSPHLPLGPPAACCPGTHSSCTFSRPWDDE